MHSHTCVASTVLFLLLYALVVFLRTIFIDTKVQHKRATLNFFPNNEYMNTLTLMKQRRRTSSFERRQCILKKLVLTRLHGMCRLNNSETRTHKNVYLVYAHPPTLQYYTTTQSSFISKNLRRTYYE